MKPYAHIANPSFHFLTVVLSAFFFLNIVAQSAPEIRSNYEILDSLSGLAAGILCNALVESGDSVYAIESSPNSASQRAVLQLIEKNAVANCKPKSISFLANSDSTVVPVVELLIIKFGVSYSNHPEVDLLLERGVFCEIDFTIKKNNAEIIPGKTIKFAFSDTVGRGSIKLIENSGYDFAKATVPEPEDSFFKQIAEPLIIISSAAIAVFLFFTVRSG